MTKALLLIDIQNDYFPGGAMELAESSIVGEKAGRLLHAFRQKAQPIIHIQHISAREGATFFLPYTDRVKIHESVAPLATETLFQKRYPNSFRETPLLLHLHKHQITTLVIAGMMTHMCIDTKRRVQPQTLALVAFWLMTHVLQRISRLEALRFWQRMYKLHSSQPLMACLPTCNPWKKYASTYNQSIQRESIYFSHN
jgi:hypothetical protein